MRKILGLALILAMALAPLTMPDRLTSNAQAQTPAADPPGRVGRLNYMNGPVSYAPGGVNQWAQATLNYPLTTGTALWTDQNGRAELHIGSTAIRMDETTELDILNLDDQTTQLRVSQGTVDIGLLRLEADERFEVATPSASVALVRPGHYRFEVDDNAVRIIVRKGQVDIETSTGTRSIYSGQAVSVSDDGGYQMMATPAVDDFGRWSFARQADEERALQAAAPYVSPAMTGYEDLAPYGAWRHVGGYGAAWFPRVAPGWAPYRHGRWVWASPWGWTWVDEAPWGFAPFHYGRWVVIGAVWAWIPGPIVVRPVFAPALVVFIVIGEAIGWFPLAPYEAYVPPYYASPVYRRSINVNIVNINITNINVTNVRYVYGREPHAITIVRRGAFGQGDRVGGSIIAPGRGDIDRGHLSASAPMQPRVESVLGRPQGSGGSHQPPAVVEQRPVVVRHTPPAPIRPQVSTPGTQMRNVPVRPVNERRDPRPAPQQPVPVQPGAVPPAPAQPQPARPVPQAPQPNAPGPQPGGTAPQPRPQVVQPQPVPQPNAVPTPHRRRPNEQAPQPNVPAPQQNAPAPAPQAAPPNAPVPPNAPAPQPRPQVVQPQPASQPNAVPTPHRRRPNEQAPQPNPGAPQPPQPPAPVPAPQPQAPAPQPRPPIVQPAPEPNPIPTPRPGGVVPQPRPQQPVVAPPQPVPTPRQAQPEPPREQPHVRAPQPAPTPQVNPAPPQVRPAPQPPRGQIRQPVCDERSPNHDPRLCPQNRTRRH